MPIVCPALYYSAAFTDSAIDNGGGASYTFTSKSIGTAEANRRVFVIFCCQRNDTVSLTVTSATIGGVAATIAGQIEYKSGTNHSVCILYADVPTDTTATIVINKNFASNSGSIHVYAVYGSSNVSFYSASNTTGITLSGDGVYLAGAMDTTTVALTASGFVDDGSLVDGSYRSIAGHLFNYSGSQTFTVSESVLALAGVVVS